MTNNPMPEGRAHSKHKYLVERILQEQQEAEPG